MNKYQTFWPRLVAIIIDGFVLQFAGEIINLIPTFGSSFLETIHSIISSNIPYVYAILMLGKYGQTLGKMAMKIKVVDHETEQEISYRQSLMREIIPLSIVNATIIIGAIIFSGEDMMNYELSVIGFILLFLPAGTLFIWSILEIITMLFDDKNRALHDIVADTVVIKTNA